MDKTHVASGVELDAQAFAELPGKSIADKIHATVESNRSVVVHFGRPPSGSFVVKCASSSLGTCGLDA